MPGRPRDRLPVPREALTHIVILEGMEKVASQLPVVSWSARGIANATYVVWRILQEMRGEAMRSLHPHKNTMGAEHSPACPSHIPSTCPHPLGSHQHPSAEKGGPTHPLCNSLTFGSPSMSPDPAQGGHKRRRALLSMQAWPPCPPALFPPRPRF